MTTALVALGSAAGATVGRKSGGGIGAAAGVTALDADGSTARAASRLLATFATRNAVAATITTNTPAQMAAVAGERSDLSGVLETWLRVGGAVHALRAELAEL